MEDQPKARVSVPPILISLQSSDDVLYKVHRKNLEVHSESFAAVDAITSETEAAEPPGKTVESYIATLNGWDRERTLSDISVVRTHP